MLIRWNDVDFGFGDMDRSLFSLAQVRRDMDRFFGNYEREMQQNHGKVAEDSFRVQLFDRGESLMLRAELPGVSDKDLDIAVQQNTLSLKAQRKLEKPEGYAVHRNERSNFQFARSFRLPSKVIAEKAVATLKDGILTLTLPKAPEMQPRRIKVNV
jgi:HSP20 family protein